MIAHTAEEPLQKITLNIFARDYHRMLRLHGQGYSVVIRMLVRRYLREREELEHVE